MNTETYYDGLNTANRDIQRLIKEHRVVSRILSENGFDGELVNVIEFLLKKRDTPRQRLSYGKRREVAQNCLRRCISLSAQLHTLLEQVDKDSIIENNYILPDIWMLLSDINQNAKMIQDQKMDLS